jgi:hypothetical protein
VIRQYHAQRRQGGANPLGVGVVALGTIVYLQNEGWWRDRYRGKPICRNPWIVTAFLNGMIAATRLNIYSGRWEDLYVARRSDIEVVRSLRDGRQRQVAVRMLILHDDEGLVRQPSLYPALPNMRLWHARRCQITADERGCQTNQRRKPSPIGAPETTPNDGSSTYAVITNA